MDGWTDTHPECCCSAVVVSSRRWLLKCRFGKAEEEVSLIFTTCENSQSLSLARDRACFCLLLPLLFFIWCFFIIYILSCDVALTSAHHHMHSHTWASLMILLDIEFIARAKLESLCVKVCGEQSRESRAGLCTVLDEASRWLIYSTNNEHVTLTLWLLSKLSARSSFGMITFFSRQPTWTESSHTKRLQSDDAAAQQQQMMRAMCEQRRERSATIS